MADRRLGFDITAQDNASGVFKRIASSAAKELGDVQDEMDDTRSAGQRMAAAMGSVLDGVEREIADTERAAARLGQALGPELKAKLGDAAIDRAVQDFRRLGLTFEDIEAAADDLATQIKRADEISDRAAQSGSRAFAEMGDAARKAGSEVDQTRSVVANFAGNAVQELPGVTAAFGPLGMAAGQFAEYAAEGNISLKNFVAYAGPLAGTALIVNEIANEFKRAAETRAFRREQVADWAAAIREGRGQVEILADEIDRTGQLLSAFDELGNRGELDILPDLAELGITVDQFAQLSRLSRDELLAWNDAVKASGADVDTAARVYYAAKDAGEQFARAQHSATVTARVLGDAVEVVNERLEDNRRRNDEAREAERRRTEGVLTAAQADLALADAVDATTSAIDDATAATDDSSTSVDEQAAAWRRAEDAAIAEANAAVDAANAHYGGALTAQQAAQIQIDSLTRVANTLDPGSPLRARLEGYINQLRAVPTDVTTRFNATYASQVKAPSAIFGGARAAGGPVSAGVPYLVGEAGREMFVPDSDGTIVPHSALGAPATAQADVQPLNLVVQLDSNTLIDALVKFERRNGSVPITVKAVA